MDVKINRLDPNVPDPVESRRRAAGRLVRIAYATIVFGVLAFFVIYFGAPFVYLGGPGTVSSPRYVVSLPYTVQVNQMNLAPGATVKAGEEIAEVLSPEQDSIVATYMRALADIAGRTAELRIKARAAGIPRSGALLSARDPGSSRTPRRYVHGHCDLPHGSVARVRLGAQSRCLAGGGSRGVRHSTCLPGSIYPTASRPPRRGGAPFRPGEGVCADRRNSLDRPRACRPVADRGHPDRRNPRPDRHFRGLVHS